MEHGVLSPMWRKGLFHVSENIRLGLGIHTTKRRSTWNFNWDVGVVGNLSESVCIESGFPSLSGFGGEI